MSQRDRHRVKELESMVADLIREDCLDRHPCLLVQ